MPKHLASADYSDGAPGGVVASGSSLVLPRAAAGTRGQHSTLPHRSYSSYARAAEGGAGEEERRRDEGTGERAKEVARAVGGKARAWVMQQEDEVEGRALWEAGVMERSCAVARKKTSAGSLLVFLPALPALGIFLKF
jgi:hypothetical protein